MQPVRIIVLAGFAFVVLTAGAVGGYFLLAKPNERSNSSSLPTGWKLCTNRLHGFAIGYPAGWYEESGYPAQGSCAFFDPKPFEFERGVFYTAMVVSMFQRWGPGGPLDGTNAERDARKIDDFNEVVPGSCSAAGLLS